MSEIKIERVGDRFLLYEGGYRIGELNPRSVTMTPAPAVGRFTIRYSLPGKAETEIKANTPQEVDNFRKEILHRGGVILAVLGE